jgi:hypothetical protein
MALFRFQLQLQHQPGGGGEARARRLRQERLQRLQPREEGNRKMLHQAQRLPADASIHKMVGRSCGDSGGFGGGFTGGFGGECGFGGDGGGVDVGGGVGDDDYEANKMHFLSAFCFFNTPCKITKKIKIEFYRNH